MDTWVFDYWYRDGEDRQVNDQARIAMPGEYCKVTLEFLKEMSVQDRTQFVRREYGVIGKVHTWGVELWTPDQTVAAPQIILPAGIITNHPDPSSIYPKEECHTLSTGDVIYDVKMIVEKKKPFQVFSHKGKLIGYCNKGLPYIKKSSEIRGLEHIARFVKNHPIT